MEESVNQGNNTADSKVADIDTADVENLTVQLKEVLNLNDTDPKQLSQLVLAYIGDSI